MVAYEDAFFDRGYIRLPAKRKSSKRDSEARREPRFLEPSSWFTSSSIVSCQEVVYDNSRIISHCVRRAAHYSAIRLCATAAPAKPADACQPTADPASTDTPSRSTGQSGCSHRLVPRPDPEPGFSRLHLSARDRGGRQVA